MWVRLQKRTCGKAVHESGVPGTLDGDRPGKKSSPFFPTRQAMENLLRELEKQLATMTAEQRAATTSALAGIISASRGMKDLHLSRATVWQAIQMMGVGFAQGKTMASHLVEARRLAPKIGKHVEALVHAVS